MPSIKIGMCQIQVDNAASEANLDRARAAIEVAVSQGAELVVLPETLDLGWMDRSARTKAEPIPGPRSQYFAELARRHGVMIACGLTESATVDGRSDVHNAAVLLSRTGEIVLRHRKINEVPSGRGLYATGTSLTVAETELGTIGLNICADNFSQSAAIGQTQGIMGAQIIVSPSSWALDPHLADSDNIEGQRWIDHTWVEPYQALARRYDMAVVGVSNVGSKIADGELAGRTGIGGSLVVGRDGAVLARSPYGQDAAHVQTVDVELRP